MEILATISQGMFPNNLKLAYINPAHKKGERQDKGNCRPVSILFPISLKYMKEFCTINYITHLTTYYLYLNVVLEEVTVQLIAILEKIHRQEKNTVESY